MNRQDDVLIYHSLQILAVRIEPRAITIHPGSQV